ncbi:hypothetical protein J1D01_03750 [Seonamhaeicola sp. NFXS20]|uniref:hypothetical protein n=1 Tax=Seonamhaeicola sp. NFXS20 TaxID=2816959 RepID=UPI003B8D0D4E
MKNQKYYTCQYCYQEFVPKRRRVQKYCSNTCRSKAYHERKTKGNLPVTSEEKLPKSENTEQKDSMSLSGVGNAAAGSLLADGIKALVTKNDNKAATKGDIKELINKLTSRYYEVKNIPPRSDGAIPYFDIETNMIVYF